MENETNDYNKPVTFKITTSAADKKKKLELLFEASKRREKFIAECYAKAALYDVDPAEIASISRDCFAIARKDGKSRKDGGAGAYSSLARDIAKLFVAELHNQKLIRDCLKG